MLALSPTTGEAVMLNRLRVTRRIVRQRMSYPMRGTATEQMERRLHGARIWRITREREKAQTSMSTSLHQNSKNRVVTTANLTRSPTKLYFKKWFTVTVTCGAKTIPSPSPPESYSYTFTKK